VVAPLRAGPPRLDPRTHAATQDGRPPPLTPTEFCLLHHLMLNGGAVVPTRTLMKRVWGFDDPSGKDSVRVAVHRLRGKLNAGPPVAQHLLRTVSDWARRAASARLDVMHEREVPPTAGVLVEPLLQPAPRHGRLLFGPGLVRDPRARLDGLLWHRIVPPCPENTQSLPLASIPCARPPDVQSRRASSRGAVNRAVRRRPTGTTTQTGPPPRWGKSPLVPPLASRPLPASEPGA
jgi:hypothetical protein